VPRWRQGSGQGWLSAEYRLLPASTPERQGRELMKLSGRTQEIQRLIGRSLRASLDMAALGERTLLVDCDVLQADAGTRTASITGAWLALAVGLRRLQNQGLLLEDPLRQQVAAVAVGLVDGRPLLDLDYGEDSRAAVDLNVVMDGQGRLLEIQGTAEGAPFSRPELNAMLDLAQGGITELQAHQKQALAAAPGAPAPRTGHAAQNDEDHEAQDQQGQKLVEDAISSRTLGRACHSPASLVRMVMTSSTPRSTPPPKSPTLKRGAIALAMTIFERASVRVPSSP
jgi:ribonuclease PH